MPGSGPVLDDVVDQARPRPRRSGCAAPSATAGGRRTSSGRIISPGENQRSDSCTASTAIAIAIAVSPTATRRFLVMNWCLARSENQLPARCSERAEARAADVGAGTLMTCADYPQIAGLARRPRSYSRSVAPCRRGQRKRFASSGPSGIRSPSWQTSTRSVLSPMTSTRHFAGFMIIRSTPARRRPHGGPGCAGSSRRNGHWRRSIPALPAGRGDWSARRASTASRWRCPGAVFPVAGVTAVSVLPTHRRRGILRSLMQPPARRHRGPGRGADRGAVGLGDAAVRSVRVRAGVLARVLPVRPRRGRAQRAGSRRPLADAAAGRAARGCRGPGQGL